MRQSHVLIAAAVSLAGLLAACGDDSPAGPTPTDVTKVEINGPSTIAPGQTAYYSVIETLTNGTTRALPTAQWSSSNTSLVQITSGGAATAQPRNGEAVLTVRTTRQASKEIIVLPNGTFRLVGTISDAGPANLPIPGAQVEVVGGPSVTTASSGTYRLIGVPPDAEIRISREGYTAHQERVQLTGHATRNFRLTVDDTGRNYSGPYTLVVRANPTCPGYNNNALRPDLRTRTYDAQISQRGSDLEVQLTEPRFQITSRGRGDRFVGSVTPTGASFRLDFSYYYYYGPSMANLTEVISDGSLLWIYGNAPLTGSPSGLNGTFNGWLSHLSGNNFLGGCQASTMSFTPR